jgi:YopJ family protease
MRQMQQLPESAAGAHRRCEEQLKRTQRYIDAGKRADRSLLEGDLQTMADFAAIKNHRHPGLNLLVADSVSTLRERLKDMPQSFHLRCVLRSSSDLDDSLHHIYADIQRISGGPLSFVMIEPADINDNLNAVTIVLQLFTQMKHDAFFSKKRMTCFNARVQKSGSDCMVFCVDFALKAHEHASELNALHALHHRGHAIGNDANDPAIDLGNRDTLSFAPAFLLPAAFFEHAQSISALHDMAGDHEGAAHLRERIRKMRAQRAMPREPAAADCQQPASIEFLRRQFLIQAITALAASGG